MNTAPRPLGREEIIDCFTRAGVWLGTNPDDVTRNVNAVQLALALSALPARIALDADDTRPLFDAAMTQLGNPIRKNRDGSLAGMNAHRWEGWEAAMSIFTPCVKPGGDTRNGARYTAWRDAMVAQDQKFIDAMALALPAAVGHSREPTAVEWDAAVDKAAGLPTTGEKA